MQNHSVTYQNISFSIYTLCLFAMVGYGLSQSAQAAGLTELYTELAQRTTADRAAFYIYQDTDSGFNHGFPSGFFGTIDTIHLNAACVNDPNASNGCSSNPDALDRARGNVLMISFDPQAVATR